MSAMADSATSYIRLVQHLIEECILFKMSKEECVEALTKHAQIDPVISSTVWKELEKENKEFFEEYAKTIKPAAGEEEKPAAAMEEEEGGGGGAETPRQNIQNQLPDSI